MIWAIVVIIIIFIIYKFSKDRNDMLVRQVDLQGGMSKKYEILISLLTNDPIAKIVKVTRDHIHIRAALQTTCTDFFITESFNEVNIEWIGQLGLLGTHKKSWKFAHNHPQDKMVEQINEFLEWKSNQMFGI